MDSKIIFCEILRNLLCIFWLAAEAQSSKERFHFRARELSLHIESSKHYTHQESDSRDFTTKVRMSDPELGPERQKRTTLSIGKLIG